ncbi:hypothetical protein [Metallosphaera hakonensis]|uniref:hypothetical protein n=1 Tax=Metallosphaera hakonensis TaxID=79601 RepID=UPI0006D05FC7|nr:hypothetical protein [Metallosphaera hakonensis]
MYFRPIQYVIVQGITYKPEYGNQPPNGVFRFENVTVLNLSQNVTLKIVVDGVAQNLTLPVFHGAVGVPATGTLVPVNSSS